MGDNIRIDVKMKCPECESFIWARSQFRFSSLYMFPKFTPVRQCSICLKRFNDAEGGLLPYDRQLWKWQKLSRLHRDITHIDIMICFQEDVRKYIPPGSRQAEKVRKKRRKAFFLKVTQDYYEN